MSNPPPRRVLQIERDAAERRDKFLHDLSNREVPASSQAEQALLGGILANNRAYERVAGYLRPEHFYDPVHAAIYAEVQILIDAGRVADAITMNRILSHTGVLDEVGSGYLAQLLVAMVSPMMVGEYGQTIFDQWRRRQMIEVAAQLYADAHTGDFQVPDGATRAIEKIDGLMQDPSKSTGPTGKMVIDAVDEALASADEAAARGGPIGYSTGFPALDRGLMGLRDAGLYVIAARPGMGKSALALQVADSVARQCQEQTAIDGERAGVVLISLEMSAEDLATRMLAYRSGVSAETMMRGEHEPHVHGLLNAREAIGALPLIIEDVPGMRIGEINLKVRAAARRLGKVRLILVDHMHIVRIEQGQTPTWGVGEISNALKRMAKEYRCPVVALAQLSRGVESRDDKRPTMSDLRQSGEIEQDADAIVFIYREEYYIQQTGEPEQRSGESLTQFIARQDDYATRRARAAGKAELILAKVRHNAGTIIQVAWDGPTTSFRSL